MVQGYPAIPKLISFRGLEPKRPPYFSKDLQSAIHKGTITLFRWWFHFLKFHPDTWGNHPN